MTNPNLKINERKKGIDIDICIPKVTGSQVSVFGNKGYTKKVIRQGVNTDFVHIVLPKNKR